MKPSIISLPAAQQRVLAEGVPVHGAPATGLPLHSNGHLGADILHVAAGKQFPVHVHPGDHLLYCLSGQGSISVDGETYDIEPGDLYMVDGMVPHAVGARTDHVLVSIGSPHKPVASPERMTWTDWHGNPVAAPVNADGSTAADLAPVQTVARESAPPPPPVRSSPSIARLVHYVPLWPDVLPACRAAVVTDADPFGPQDGIVSLAVLGLSGVSFQQGVQHDPGSEARGYRRGTWHWPERV